MDWAVCVIVCGPGDKIPLVLEPQKNRSLWKLPGGRKEKGETPEDTAAREVQEETGLIIKPVSLLPPKERRGHFMYLFGATVDSFDDLLEVGSDGEKVSLFCADNIVRMKNFLRSHLELLEEAKLIAPRR